MEKHRKESGDKPAGKEEKSGKEMLVHDVTVMMNEPIKVTLPYGARYSDLLKKAEEEFAKQGKTLKLKEYSGMLNDKAVGEGEDPILIRASVVSLLKKITGGQKVC